MSKSSLRNQKAETKEVKTVAQEETQQQEEIVIPAQTVKPVKPVTLDSRKGKTVPKTRQQKQVKPAKKTTKSATQETKAASQNDMPSWLEGYLKYQSEFTMQISDQVIEDHEVLTDHEWRLRDVEKRLGIEPQPPEPKLVKKAKPAEPVEQDAPTEPIPPTGEPTSETKEPKTKEPEVKEPEANEPVTETVSESKGAIPREMYEAKSFENGKWRLRGPYKRISQAEQAAQGDLSKVRIVQVWYDPEREIVLGYLTAEEMDRYC